MFSDQIVIDMRQRCKPFRCIRHHCFRTVECLIRLQRPVKHLLREPHLDPSLVVLVPFRFESKIAAVHEAQPITGTVLFHSILVRQDKKRIMLVSRHPPAASELLISVDHRDPLHIPFHHMSSVEMQQIILPAREVNACAVHFIKEYHIAPSVGHSHTPRDHILFRQHSVPEHNLQAKALIFQRDLSRVRFLLTGIYSRKSGDAVFPVFHPEVPEPKIRTEYAPVIPCIRCRAAEIAVPVTRIFQRHHIRRKRPVHPGSIRIAGEAPVPGVEQKAHIAFRPWPVI